MNFICSPAARTRSVLYQNVEAPSFHEYSSTYSRKVTTIAQKCLESAYNYSHFGQHNRIPLEAFETMKTDLWKVQD